MNDWEARFVNTLAQFAELEDYWLTKKQLAVVDKLTARLGYEGKTRQVPPDDEPDDGECAHDDDGG